MINHTWTAAQFRASFFDRPTARGLNSLNSHFAHDRFFPNVPGDDVLASEVADGTHYAGGLIFSVGCQSGLNVPTGVDWAEAFAGRSASFIDNTGHGYGDDELIAYSERLMTNFVEDWARSAPRCRRPDARCWRRNSAISTALRSRRAPGSVGQPQQGGAARRGRTR